MANPTVRRRQLGQLLRKARETAGVSARDAAEHLEVALPTLGRWESAQRGIRVGEVRRLCELYGVDKAETEAMVTLAREAQRRGWWQSYSVSETYRTLIGLEDDAAVIWSYQSLFVPGLLQTPAYAEAVIRGTIPALTPEELSNRVRVRMERQELLRRDEAPLLQLVLDEAALSRTIGGPDVMAGQLTRLAELAGQPNIGIQLIPFEVGAHPGMTGAFSILQFAPDSGLPDVGFVESPGGDVILERAADLSRLTLAFGDLRSLALSPGDTVAWLMAAGQQ